MTKEVWNTYATKIESTKTVISVGEKSTEVDTSKAWYTVDAEGNYTAENFVAYHATFNGCVYKRMALRRVYRFPVPLRFFDRF